jgi:hypothetical protein
MATYGEVTVGEILSDRPLRLTVAAQLAVSEAALLEGVAGISEETMLENLCTPAPADFIRMSASEARGNHEVITRIAEHTGLSIEDVSWQLRKNVTHGRTLLPKVFTFIWLDRPRERTAEPRSKRVVRVVSPPVVQDVQSSTLKASVFISYTRADRKFLDAFKIHLRPLERDSNFEIWDDSKIKPGSKWRDEISSAIERASAAILFISAGFLASDFIHLDEIPPLLAQAQQRGTRILPLIVGHSLFTEHPVLSTFSAFNDPKTPLSALGKNQRDMIYVKVAKELEAMLKKGQRS